MGRHCSRAVFNVLLHLCRSLAWPGAGVGRISHGSLYGVFEIQPLKPESGCGRSKPARRLQYSLIFLNSILKALNKPVLAYEREARLSVGALSQAYF